MKQYDELLINSFERARALISIVNKTITNPPNMPYHIN